MADLMPIQVLITSGREDVERAVLGLNTALVAASSGVDVVVFFSLLATRWTCLGDDSPRVPALIELLLETGAQLECCAACLEEHCVAGGDALPQLRHGIRPSGLAKVAQRAATGVQTLSF